MTFRRPLTDVDYACTEGELPAPALHGVHALHRSVFSTPTSLDDFRERVSTKRGLLSVLASRGGTIVGYKIGYARSPEEFYSWLGGVAPEARGQGMGSELMRRQHERVCALGYARIVTETKNQWRDMLVLDLRHGFDVVGAYTDERGEPKIILVKTLRR